eukprot:scaffold53809_cov34-Attheya_sp.AAC.3
MEEHKRSNKDAIAEMSTLEACIENKHSHVVELAEKVKFLVEEDTAARKSELVDVIAWEVS